MTALRLLLSLLPLAAAPCATAFERDLVQGAVRLELRSESSGTALPLWDSLTLTFTVEGSKALEVEPPRDVQPATGWTLLSTAASATTTVDGQRRRWQQTLLLAPQQPGAVALPLPSIRYRDGGSTWTTASWPPLTISVVAEASADPGKLRARATVEELPPVAAPPPRPWWLLLALPLLALAGAAFYLLRRRSTRRPARSPAQAALRHWQRLMASNLPETGCSERFITLLTIVVRRYLQEEFQLPARRQTTAELLQALAGAERWAEAERNTLAALLQRCDRLKFGGAAVPAAECRQLAEQVRAFVERTSSPQRR
jgi:hypothetical protein